jgi:MATE family multidrug resistance protein
VLVYGHLGAPALGTVGSAYATLASRVAMVAMALLLGVDLTRACWPGWKGTFALAPMLRIAAIGIPVGLQVAMEVWAFTGTTLMMGWVGTTAVAAHMIALNLSSISFMVPFGISAAAATRVGNLLGAGQRWTHAGWTAVGVGAGVMALSACGFTLFPGWLAGLYTTDAAVIALTSTLLPLAAVFQLFDGTQVVAFGVLRGAGDTRVPALANLVGYWFLGLPVGTWLAFHEGWGPYGLWTGLTLGLATVAVLLLWRLRATARRGGYRV